MICLADNRANTMTASKKRWVHKYAIRALDYWQGHTNQVSVSDEYRSQLEDDLSVQYDDPLKREFIEQLWISQPSVTG